MCLQSSYKVLGTDLYLSADSLLYLSVITSTSSEMFKDNVVLLQPTQYDSELKQYSYFIFGCKYFAFYGWVDSISHRCWHPPTGDDLPGLNLSYQQFLLISDTFNVLNKLKHIFDRGMFRNIILVHFPKRGELHRAQHISKANPSVSVTLAPSTKASWIFPLAFGLLQKIPSMVNTGLEHYIFY